MVPEGLDFSAIDILLSHCNYYRVCHSQCCFFFNKSVIHQLVYKASRSAPKQAAEAV